MKSTNYSSILKGTMAVIAAMILGTSMAQAQATRTWVSGVGDDVNPCSRTAPCKTFAGAISKTAAGGEIDVLDPGGFGTVTITKSITIDGSPGNIGSILSSGTNGVIINGGGTAPANSIVVNLRNLSINGAGTTIGLNGIDALTAAEVNVENCAIVQFSQAGISVTPTSIGMRVNVKDCVIRDCAGGAISSKPATGFAAVVNVTNSHLLTSLAGIRAFDGTTATLENCILSGNTNNGIAIASTSAACVINANNCVAADNGIYGVVASGPGPALIRISNCSVTANATGLATLSGGTMVSFGNNRVKGNAADTSFTPAGSFTTAAQQ